MGPGRWVGICGPGLLGGFVGLGRWVGLWSWVLGGDMWAWAVGCGCGPEPLGGVVGVGRQWAFGSGPWIGLWAWAVGWGCGSRSPNKAVLRTSDRVFPLRGEPMRMVMTQRRSIESKRNITGTGSIEAVFTIRSCNWVADKRGAESLMPHRVVKRQVW